MVIEQFLFTRTPDIIFGKDSFLSIGMHVQKYGSTVLILTGEKSFKKSGNKDFLEKLLKEKNIIYYFEIIKIEPSPSVIDTITAMYKTKNIDVVIAIGGGSVIDAGKAISAMLIADGSVEDFLEGVGHKHPRGSKVPFIAIPTTAGTGSETTKNAVISNVAEHGYKKSLRHDNYVPDIALIDPVLSVNTPHHVTAYCGMDAFSQLIESYLSTKSNPVTDALALSGIEHIAGALIDVATKSGNNIELRTSMAYAAMLSGITLANAGLCVVHGIAGPLGGLYNIPHGLICGSLLYEALNISIEQMMNDEANYIVYLKKCAQVGAILTGSTSTDIENGCRLLLDTLQQWRQILALPGLSAYGINKQDVQKIVTVSSNKNNPIKLSNDDLERIVINSL